MTHVLIGLWFGVLAFAETRRALRREVEPKLTRDTRNLTIAAGAMLVKTFVEQPVALRLARWVERERFGLVHWLGLPRLFAVPILDYTLYLWHVLTHRVPFLWRVHRAHHTDLDLDASTATRFHFLEMLLSVPFRAGQVVVIGATPKALDTWQSLLLFSILFHHSNCRLPIRLERALTFVLVTPRLHGIHHSIAPGEVNSNFSSGLTIWDRLHGTYRDDVAQETITIGVDGYLDPAQVTIGKVLASPLHP